MLESKFNIDSYLQTIVPRIIDAFVDFYGEEERESITKKFNNIVLIGYLNITDYRSLVSDAQKEIKGLAVKKFFESVDLEFDEKLAKLFFGYPFSIKSGSLAEYYRDYDNDLYKGVTISFIGKIKKALESQGKTLSDDEIYKMLDSYKQAYKDAADYEEQTFNEKYGRYQEYLDYLEKLKTDINNKYYMLYLKEIMPYLSQTDQQKVANLDINNFWQYSFEDGGLFFSDLPDLFQNTKISSFNSESESILHNPNIYDWEKESIINDRIDYFKKRGFDHGDDYEAYLADDECKKILPSTEFADKICNLKTSFEHKAIEETLLSMPNIVASKKRVIDANLVIKEGEFLSSIIKGHTCIVPNYRLVNGQMISSPVMQINGKIDGESFDCTLIHEFNHVYELSLIDYDDKMIHSVCGWDICDDEIRDKEEISHELDRDKRSYEMLNEIINELLAQEICKLMHEKGVFFFGDKNTSVNTSRSIYSKLLCLVISFYHEFRDAIIASRKNGNIEIIYDAVGRENFDALNQLCYDYEMHFSGFKIYNLYDALEKNIDNEATRYYYDCLRKKDEIMEKMRAYAAEKEKSI